MLRPCPDPTEMFERFKGAVGPIALAKAFRLDTTFPLPTEKVWDFWQRIGGIDEAVGWGSLVYDAFGSTVVTRLGVFPPWQHHGVRTQIRDGLIDLAFMDPTIQAIEPVVLLSNYHHFARSLKEALEGTGPWRYNGILLAPRPRLQLILTRVEYQAREARAAMQRAALASPPVAP